MQHLIAFYASSHAELAKSGLNVQLDQINRTCTNNFIKYYASTHAALDKSSLHATHD